MSRADTCTIWYSRHGAQKMSKPFAWSWSALNSYETCPYRHNLTKIVKAYPEKENPQMVAGQLFHRALELRIEKGKSLPQDMAYIEPTIKRLEEVAREGTICAERRIGLTRDFEECGYFDKQVWLRTVIDCQIDLPDRSLITDWKTGKVKDDYDQLALSAAVKFAITPECDKVTTSYFWFSQGKITRETFVRDDAPRIWQNIMPRVIKLERAIIENDFPKKQSGLCREHCPCINCEHNGNYQGA